MTVFTLFLNPYCVAFPDDVDDPWHSKDSAQMSGSLTQNIIAKKTEQVILDAAQSHTLNFTNELLANWKYLIIKVVGEVTINTVGVDFNGTTPLTASLPVYGTTIYPGIGVLSTYNVSSIVLTGITDNTVVQVFVGIAAADNDPRIDELE